MKRFIFGFLFFILICVSAHGFELRIGDVTNVKGVRPNQLIGYGIVAGLQGTGDGNTEEFTIQSIANALKKMNVSMPANIVSGLQTKNIAAVIVTAQLPPFAKEGNTIDVTVSSIGDAKSLQGGTLLLTPLKAPNGAVYAVAQGSVSIGGYNMGSGGTRVRKNHSTVGTIPNGAIVERHVDVNINAKQKITLDLKKQSFLMSSHIAASINKFYRSHIADPVDSGSVDVAVPDLYKGNVVEFISQINQLHVESTSKPVVVLDEKTGTVVIGGDVTIEPVSISHGDITVTIESIKRVSQPNSFAKGKTKRVTNKKVSVEESKGSLLSFSKGANVGDLVNALNKSGATPRDMMAIFEAIKRAGALNADLKVM